MDLAIICLSLECWVKGIDGVYKEFTFQPFTAISDKQERSIGCVFCFLWT
jgi:hypothetical protein